MARRRFVRGRGLGLALLALCASCATYNDRTAEAMRAFSRGDLEQAEELYARKVNSEFLAGAEAGMIALTSGDWERALERLGAAASAVEDYENRALANPKAVAEETLEWTISATAGPYAGEGYERVLLHAGLGIAYLARGGVEDVLVECKRADDLLTSEERLYRKQYGAGGLGHCLSALAYELLGEPDEAYLDYRRMHEKGLGGEFIGPALVRLAEELGHPDEADQWRASYGDVEPLPPGRAQIVVIAGVGIGPFKEEARLDIPLPGGVFSVAIPRARDRAQSVRRLTLRRGETSVRTVVVEDVSRVLSESIEDRIGLLTLRSTLRGTLKYLGTRELEREHGLIGLLVGSAVSIATERADLRCWNTLPDTWQMARMYVEPGIQRLSLEAVGGDRMALGTFILDPEETMFVFARTVGPRLYAHPIGGLRTDPEILSEIADASVSLNPTPEPR